MSINEILEINNLQIIKKQKIIKDSIVLKNSQYVLPTGARNFDETLGGGFQQRKKYLIFGANKTGKTQLCHQLCVQAYIHFSKYIKKYEKESSNFIFYFDTENTFRPERLKEIINNNDAEYNDLLKNIIVSKIMSNSAMLLSLKELENLIKANSINILIIDTINNHYNSELANKDISPIKAKTTFLKILDEINKLTCEYNLITITTAQVISNIISETSIRVVPVGNHLLNQYFSEYLYLEYKEQDQRYVHLVNSINLPEKRMLYKITSSGIQDYKI
ncbi:MAG: hypothetical protein ACFFB6_11160 [Promethearchaeota archaeon]